MKPQVRRQLEVIRGETGLQFGKLVQKLLAIAFLETEAKNLVECSIQGVDLQMVIAGTSYAFEVKTSEGDEVSLGRKDIEGLNGNIERGKMTFIAVLGDRLTDEWIFSRYHPGELPSGKRLSTFQFRPYRDSELEARVNPAFEEAVSRYAQIAVQEGQKGLDRILARYPERSLA